MKKSSWVVSRERGLTADTRQPVLFEKGHLQEVLGVVVGDEAPVKANLAGDGLSFLLNRAP